MNTKTIQPLGAWGRIVQMMKVDLYAQRRATLFALGALFILIFVFPRVPILISGVSYADWATSISGSGASYSATIFVISVLWGGFMSLIYINRRVRHSYPLPFVLLPVRLWEKIVGVGLFSLGMYLVALFVFGLSDFLNFLTIDGYSSCIQVDGFSLSGTIALLAPRFLGDAMSILVRLAVYLSVILAAISFRQLRVGLFVWLLAWGVGLFLLMALGLYIFKTFGLQLEQISQEVGFYWIALVLALIDGLLVWGIYHRLRTLEC